MKILIDKLFNEQTLNKDEWHQLITHHMPHDLDYLSSLARRVQNNVYGNQIYIRGLIEFTNYCQNNCYYCGIRSGNVQAKRYRLDKESILSCCRSGYQLGFRTFVLQGGEDPFYNDDILIDIVSNIHQAFPDCAITLSVGERSYASYQKLFDAGANRYLLRHETYNAEHYNQLHPDNLTAKHRQSCLFNLKRIGFQVGAGFMVGSPYQTIDHIVEDLIFLKELSPHMIGIGPFLPHHDTPFKARTAGSLKLTLFLLAAIRLMLPTVLLPATTALNTLSSEGRKLGILAGANVVMPNLSPTDVRSAYSLYDHKVSFGNEAAEAIDLLKTELNEIGYEVAINRGDPAGLSQF